MNRMNRRRMLGISGAGALAAFLAACGKQDGVTESPNIRALGVPAPEFYHCPLMTDDQGVRLAKRHDALSLRRLRAAGSSPAQLRAQW